MTIMAIGTTPSDPVQQSRLLHLFRRRPLRANAPAWRLTPSPAPVPRRRIPLLLAAGALLLSGCRSPETHRKRADRAAAYIIAEQQRALYGEEAPFRIDRSADRLRQKLLEEQGLPGGPAGGVPQPLPTPGSGEPFRFSLEEALQIGARNHADLQSAKEAIFRAALELDLRRDRFRASWPALLSATGIEDRGTDPGQRGVEGRASAGVGVALQSGAELAAKLTLDLVKLLTLDRESAYGLLADASLSLPLLRGAGRAVVTEPLTQAERNVAYAMYEYDRLRQIYAVRLARDYLAVLEQAQKVRNAEENARRLNLAVQRAERLSEAGRQSDLFVNQARQDRLRSQNRLQSARQSLEQRMDALKTALGLPVDARIELDPKDLERLMGKGGQLLDPNGSSSDDLRLTQSERQAAGLGWTEADLIRLALDTRRDWIVAQGRRQDAERAVAVSADALRAGLSLTVAGRAGGSKTLAGAETGDTPLRLSEGRATARLEWSPPWDRTRERNAYREALLAVDVSQRELERVENGVKSDVRDALRSLLRARENGIIQMEAARVAQRRTESADLFLRAGRAQIRDSLEAQEALITAQDAWVSAVVGYRLAELALQRDLGVLDVNTEGLWNELDLARIR